MSKKISVPKRVMQCMSCFYFKNTSKTEYSCKHKNDNKPDDSSFCYDYKDCEGCWETFHF